jgi:hypothetical protein
MRTTFPAHLITIYMIFNFDLQHAIRKVQDKQVGMKLNGTHQFLVYAHDVNPLGGSMNTIKKNTEGLIDVSKEVGLEVITEKVNILWPTDPLLGKTAKQTTRQQPARNDGSTVDNGVFYVVRSEVTSCDRPSSFQLVCAVQCSGTSWLVSE